MKKISLLLVLILTISIIAIGCTNTPSNQDTSTDNQSNEQVEPETDKQEESQETQPKEIVDVVIAGLKGPTSIGMIQCIDAGADSTELENYDVSYIVEGDPSALVGKIIQNEVQIAAVPTNLASVLYNKTKGKVQFLALNTLGVLHVVGTKDISALEELEGDTLFVSGKGMTPDFAVNYLLEQKGLKDKITLDFSLDHSSLAQAVIGGDAPVAVLPQPFVTQVMMKNPDVKLLIDLNNSWNEVAGDDSVFAMGCLIINREFAKNNKEYVAEFLQKYEASVNWVNESPAEAGQLVEKNGIIPSAKLTEKAIPNCSIVYKNAQDSKDIVNGFLKVLFDSDPSSVGGTLPDEEFYYSE